MSPAGENCVFAEGENSLIVFVTGIGQSFSYLFGDEYLSPCAFASGTLQDYENYAPLIAEGKFEKTWNLFPSDFAARMRQKKTRLALAPVLRGVLGSLMLRKNRLKSSDVRAFAKELFAGCVIDENGDGDPRVVTPRYALPLSRYPYITRPDGSSCSRAKERFYACVPCADVSRRFLGDDFEDYLYCFNYKPYSTFSRTTRELHEFIGRILDENEVGAKEVVLIPMSMGASVVDAYLARYPDRRDNHVRRVVSVVGCHRGSDALYRLVTQQFLRKPAVMLRDALNGKKGIGAAAARAGLCLFGEKALDGLLYTALDGVIREVIFDAPTLMCLIPEDRYAEAREMAVSGAVLADADEFQRARLTLRDRLNDLSAQGVTFGFIAGYGLPFGADAGDFEMLGWVRGAENTNSDGVIQIESTVPGAASVPCGERFGDAGGRRLSPDGSVDISGAFFPGSSWLFQGQQHELEYNETALSLALRLALGRIKTVSDCDEPGSENGYYPQFNGSRDVKTLVRRDLPRLEKYLAGGGTLTPEQQKLYDEVRAMRLSTVNDRGRDDALMKRFTEALDACRAR